MITKFLKNIQIVSYLLVFLTLTGCGGSGSQAIDQLLGHFSATPILTSVPNQTIAEEDLLKVDINNIKDGLPGNDTGMSYTCAYDMQVDGLVDGTQDCTTIPNSTVTFDKATGILQWTPHSGTLGTYEIKINGTNTDGTFSQVFTVGVRLKFNGIGQITQITGNSATLNWSPNADAKGYQIFKLNTLTGQYELYQTILGGTNSGATLTGLTPNTGYTMRVEALDSLGNPDGNVVSRSFTTTELVKLGMTASATTVSAGGVVHVTIQAYNANDSLQTVGGLPITVSIDSGTANGSFSAVTDNNDGTYSFNFTATTVGTPITLDLATNITFFLKNSVTIAVTPGAPASVNSSLIIGSNSLVSGNSTSLTASLHDAYNNPITSGVVTFAKIGGTSTGTISSVTNQGSGTYTASYLGIAAGTAQTISVAVDGVALTPTVTVAVTPGAPFSANSTLVTTTSSLPSGSDATITATLKDINNNPILSGVLVSFAKSGGTSSGSFGSVVNAGSGTYTTTYTGVTAGTAQTISVSVDGVTLIPVVSITVVPGAPLLANSSFVVTSPTVVAGNFVTLTATLKDSNSNPIDSGVTVNFTKTGGTSTGTFGTVTNQGAGVYNIRYTAVKSGTAQDLKLQVAGSDFGPTLQVTVLNGSPSPTHSTLALSSSSVVSGQSVTITATLKDDNDNLISSGSAVSFGKSGGTSTGTFGAVTNAGNGAYTTTYTGVIAGSAQTIALLVDNSALGPSQGLTVTLGAPDAGISSLNLSANSVIAGQSVTFTATIKDLNGNPISSGLTVGFSKTGGTSTGTLSAVTNQGNGVYTATYTGNTAGTTQTIQMNLGGTAFGSTQTLQVLVGAPSLANSTLSATATTIASGASAAFTATIRDSQNNPVVSGVAITFSKSGGTSTGSFGTTTNVGSGVYTVTYTGINSGTAQTIKVLTDGSEVGLSLPIAVSVGSPDLTNSSLSLSAASTIAGQSVTLTATIKDLNGNPITSGLTIGFSATGGTSTGTLSSVTNQGGGIYTATYTGNNAGTAQTLQTTINTIAFGGTQSLQVLVGSPSLANSSLIGTATSIVSGTTATFTATIRDSQNNPITTGVAMTFSKSGGTSTGTFGTPANAGSGAYTVTYTGVAAGTAQTIKIATDGTDLGLSASIAVTIGAPDVTASSLALSATTVTAGQSVTLTATIKDLNSNVIASGMTVGFSKTGGTSTGTLSAVTNQGNGVYTATYTGNAAGSAQAIQITIGGTAFGTAQNLQVLVGPPSLANSSLTPASSSIVSGGSSAFTATVRDSQNNPITSGVAITFSKSGGTSTGTFGSVTNVGSGVYTVTYTGVTAGTAQAIKILTDGADLGLSSTVTVGVGAAYPANSTLALSSNSVISGQSVTVTATLKDVNNNPVASGPVISFTKSGGTSTGTFGSIVNQGGGVYTVTYTGVVAGTAQTIKVLADSTDLGFTPTVTVTPGSPSATTSTLATSSSSVISGSSVTLTATIKDANSNPITSGVAITFAKNGGTSTGTFGAITNAGAGVYTTTYTGTTAGSAQTMSVLADGYTLGPSTSISVTPGAPSSLLSTLTTSANTVIAGQFITLTATIKDANSNPISSGVLVTFDKIGGTSFGNYATVVNQGGGIYTVTYTGVTAGTAQTVQADVNGAGFGPTQSVQVLVGAPSAANSTLTLGATSVQSGASITVSALIRDSQNNPITNQNVITFDSIGGTSTGSFGSVSNSGTGTFSTNYTGSLAGTAQTVRVLADGNPITGLTATVSVVPGAVSVANSTFSSNLASVQANTLANLSINLRDANNNSISSGSTAITFAKTTGVSDGTIATVTNAGNGNYTTTYLGTTMGAAQVVTLIVNGVNTGMTVSLTVTAGPPTHYLTSTPSGTLSSIDCNGPYSLTLKDANENTTTSTSAVTITLASNPAGAFTGTIFTDSACSTTAVSTLTFPASTTTPLQFYYKSYTPKNFTLGLTSTGGISTTNITITNVGALAWIGSSAYFTMNGTGSMTVQDDTSGGSMTPYDVAISGNYMYAMDYTGNRILKYDIVNNLFIGWIGHVGSVENIAAYDGSASCTGLSVANADLTPKWCTGGRSNPVTSSIISNPRNVAVDANYLYVASGHRILRFLQTDGSYQGWFGKISTTAATSPSACVSAGTSVTTPTWCFGGTVTSGTGDGQFNTIEGLSVYNGYLYVIDNGNQRLQRIDISTSTPAPAGWVGQVGATAPTASGQLSTCSSLPATAAATPGWCKGGTSQVSKRDANDLNGPSPGPETVPPAEGFYSPTAVTNDGTYLYVTDATNYRVVRLSLSTGAFSGWIGYVYRTTTTSPTTPAQTSSTYTTTWTQGGVSYVTSSSVGFGSPNGITVDTSGSTPYLYIADSYHRLIRLRASDGGDYRWIGRSSGSPTGGYVGCSSTPVGGVNPGWCVGGSGNKVGNTSGAFYNPVGVAFTTDKIFVGDNSNFRIQRFNKTDGTFDGWIGAGNKQSTTWTRSLTSGAIPSRSGIDDYSLGDTTNYNGLTIAGSYMYQTDATFNRVKKFNTNDGSVVGYLGQISTFPPTGPDACVGYTSGMTPTWCTGGGRTTNGSGIQAYYNPFSVASDGTYLYVGSYSNHRIDRVRVSDGLYMGWIGKISTVPTDGDSGCLTAAVGDSAPGWCIGGAATSGTVNGNYNAPRGLSYDTAGSYLYAIDNTSRLLKIKTADGSIAAVTGYLSSGSGCTITSSTANSWCTSGTGGTTGANNYGMMNTGNGITNNTNYIYVVDSGNHRLLRFDKSTGAPAGFIGKMSASTNLNTTATTFTVNSVVTTNGCYNLSGYPKATPGWCFTTVGTTLSTTSGTDNNAFNTPRGVWADDTNIYVADSANSRIVKIDAVTGNFIGWKGYITSTTGMTDSTCIAAGVGGITPTWCAGGTSGPAKSLGAFDAPSGIYGDSNYIYVIDNHNNRTITVPKN